LYISFYRLAEDPFAMGADPRFLFNSRRHQNALAYLAHGVFYGRGFLALTGEVGVGKTTVVRAFTETFRPGLEVAFVTNPTFDDADLLSMILDGFGLEDVGSSRRETLNVLNDFLITRNAGSHVPLLVIDEVGHLPSDLELFEELRMLSDLKVGSDPMIQILLVGRPELDQVLRRRELREIRQRIPSVHCIRNLSREEVGPYVGHRLRVAGMHGGAVEFTPKAIGAIYEYSNGVPRLINLVCAKALMAGYLRRTRTISEALIAECVNRLV
jgi:general secretion pathway protein A